MPSILNQSETLSTDTQGALSNLLDAFGRNDRLDVQHWLNELSEANNRGDELPIVHRHRVISGHVVLRKAS